MPDTSTRLSLPYILPAQAQKHVIHNEALQLLDGITQLTVVQFNAELPPLVPEDGTAYALGPVPTDAWAGQAGKIAAFNNEAWQFMDPVEGWRAWGQQEVALRVYHGGAWIDVPGATHNLDGIGINTVPDATNRLAVRSDASLLTHDGAGHQLKINKASAGDTASLLFQSNWTGHAEMGLAGDTDFQLKVSADGSAWTTACRVDAASGLISGAAVQNSATDVTPGRLARADYAYGPGNLVGAVTEAAGVPTGAVIERGSNASGEYVRWADGTQICTHTIWVPSATAGSVMDFTYPAAFLGIPEFSNININQEIGGANVVSLASLNQLKSVFANAVRWRVRFATYNGTDIGNVRFVLFALGRWF